MVHGRPAVNCCFMVHDGSLNALIWEIDFNPVQVLGRFALFLIRRYLQGSSKKPLTRVSKRVPGAHGKRGLERGWQKRLAKGWRKVGEGLANFGIPEAPV